MRLSKTIRTISVEVYLGREPENGTNAPWQVGVCEEHSFEGVYDICHCFLRGDGPYDDGAVMRTLIRAFELVLCSVKDNAEPAPQYIIYTSTNKLQQWIEWWTLNGPYASSPRSYPLLQRYEEITAQLHQLGIEGYLCHAEGKRIFRAKQVVELAATPYGRHFLSPKHDPRIGADEALKGIDMPRPRGSAWLATPHPGPPVVTDRWMLQDYRAMKPTRLSSELYPDPIMVNGMSGLRRRETVTCIGYGRLSLQLLERDGSEDYLTSSLYVWHCPDAPYCFLPLGNGFEKWDLVATSGARNNAYEPPFQCQPTSWWLNARVPIAEPYEIASVKEWHGHGPTIVTEPQEEESPATAKQGELMPCFNGGGKADVWTDIGIVPENEIWDPHASLYDFLNYNDETEEVTIDAY